MVEGHRKYLIYAVIVVLVLAVVFHSVKSESNVTYDIVGTYTGNFSGHFVYYVFEPLGQYCIYVSGIPSIVIDEGTYENRGNNIFDLESTMHYEHTVVCGDNIIYDFDMLNKDVNVANRTTKEIFYVNLPEKTAD